MRKICGAVIGALLLSSCGGGGGGGVASTPAPTPAPTPSPTPTPASATIGNLRANQTFTADAAQTDVSFNLTSSTTIVAKAQATSLSVRYDAASNSYEISGSGRSETFTPADRQAGTVEGETRYVHRSDGNASYLTLVTTPYLGSTPNRYVGLGYYQRNAVASERQETGFATFIYGFDTPATGVPRSGSATFATDVFGLASTPGAEPDVFQGRGRFDVDFVNGLFSTSTYVTRTGLISGKGEVGGGLDLTGGGRLSVSTGAFGGDIVYSSGSQQIAGRLTGRFFGPNADELGASFSGSTSDGSAFNGALTAQRDTTLTATNISFARMVTPQLFYADTTTLTVRTPRNGGTPAVSNYPGDLGRSVSRSTLEDKTSGNVRYGGPYSSIPGGDYTVTSIVSGDPNFTSYARTIADQPTRLDLYKTGAANRELALTYASFGRYATTNESDPFASEAVRSFFVYGFATPSGLFANRTGSATYQGVAYGAAADSTGAFYDVTGTAGMTVDFGAQSLSGTLALTGSRNATSVDYGTFGFSGKIFSYGSTSASEIRRGSGSAIGSMLVNFYGPAAEEAAGIYRLRVPDGAGAGTLVTGAMVAKAK